MTAGEPPLLAIDALHKQFAVPVLRGIDFTLRAGEIHALMGSNGAGKSTLCNLIAGIHRPDSGNMRLSGQPYQPASLHSAEASGVRMVMQELNLFPTLSIAENLCFNRLGNRAGVINHQALRDSARAALARLNLDELDPDTPVSALGVGKQQLVEIARVLAQPVRLLILDEPTAALTDPQIDQLFGQLDILRSAGIGIIYISHRMSEIQRVADRVSILRDGALIATENADEMDVERMVHLMAGPAMARIPPKTPTTIAATAASNGSATKPGHVVLKIEQLGRQGAFTDINLELRAGEVLGIGGLIGSGRTELLRTLFGADTADTGGIRLAADDFSRLQQLRNPAEAIAAGIGLVVEDRKGQGLLLDKSIALNIGLGQLGTLHNRLGIVNDKAIADNSAEICRQLDIKHDDLQQPVAQLSGGNQQKVLIGRWLLRDLQILLFDEPGRGVDARSKLLIQELIRDLAAQGKAVIVVSSETEELLALADRVVVLSNGRLAGEFTADTVSEQALLEASFRFYTTAGQKVAPPLEIS
ncbi:sugar ABC transporter ATP-binding protein [Kineobactrum sediminis]|uniref:Sugar ABC transporter ATP-binding protein n=1 Tax=Kineobactrum sediminis TaxID=1905677 RepID=A0A2N5XYE6_9GAMM|nr:sugar ABC transporter ATP-binding protein [Kineobactrum sediminis]PLW81174.1 sugar ABC transporter ATP-binding protein [Kineobactrum sediminis]